MDEERRREMKWPASPDFISRGFGLIYVRICDSNKYMNQGSQMAI